MILTHVYSLRKDVRWLEKRVKNYEEMATVRKIRRHISYSQAPTGDEPKSPDIHLIGEDDSDDSVRTYTKQ